MARIEFDFPLGLQWYEQFYDRISSTLGYSRQADERGRDELARLLNERKALDFDQVFSKLYDQFERKNAIVFGAGPSLEDDLISLASVARNPRHFVVAADGASDALRGTLITPDIVVSDLDSCSIERLEFQSKEKVLFVHGHGDNIELVRAIVPKLGENMLGTTQVRPVEYVRNVGGLTDGDRACFLASVFDPPVLVIAGMDFGRSEGEYSKSRRADAHNSNVDDPDGEEKRLRKREVKLRFGKENLEFLIKNKPETRFVNVTSHGEDILGTERLSNNELTKVLS